MAAVNALGLTLDRLAENISDAVDVGAAVFVLKTTRLRLRLCSSDSYQRDPAGGLP